MCFAEKGKAAVPVTYVVGLAESLSEVHKITSKNRSIVVTNEEGNEGATLQEDKSLYNVLANYKYSGSILTRKVKSSSSKYGVLFLLLFLLYFLFVAE